MIARYQTLRVVCALAVVLCVTSVEASSFYPISSITSSTSATDLFPVGNLIQGPGVGFDASVPHDQLTNPDFAGSRWVTDAPGGFPADYIAIAGMPVLTLDLGQNRLLSEISIWGYASDNANGVSAFSLRFATDADGLGGFGTSIAFNPTYFPAIGDIVRQSFSFGQSFSDRYVEFTAVDNFFSNGGFGPPPGGDRVGLGEIAFQAVPEPSTWFLMATGLIGVFGYGWRRRRTA